MQVEALQTSMLIQRFDQTAAATLGNVTFLGEVIKTRGVTATWAGLSSLTGEQWDTLLDSGEIPADYDPWRDLTRVW